MELRQFLVYSMLFQASGSVQYMRSVVYVMSWSSTERKVVYSKQVVYSEKAVYSGKLSSTKVVDQHTSSINRTDIRRQLMYNRVYAVLFLCVLFFFCFVEDSCANQVLFPAINVRCFVLLRALSLSLLIGPYLSDSP